MSTLSFNLRLVGNNSAIAKDMLNALLPDVNNYFTKIYNSIKGRISLILIEHLQKQPEYVSIMSGELKGQFGLPDSSSRLQAILESIQNNGVVILNPLKITNNKLRGSIKLQMVQKNFEDLLSLGESSFTTEKGQKLDWLRWLLKEGDSIIISEYYFIAGPYSNSRTGLGIMHKFEGSSWRVPPEFAGTINNNWITRAINSASSDIENELQILARTSP